MEPIDPRRERRFTTRTHGIVARDADVAIVLRRGPARRVRLLRWNLADDTIEPGQWLAGSVVARDCGVSSDGALFVYFARKGEQTFTAVSRPPYFTALACWKTSQLRSGTGGGFFVDEDHLVLRVTHDPDHGQRPPGLTVSDVWSYLPWSGNARSPAPRTFGEAYLEAPAAHQGWLRVAGRWIKAHPRDPAIILERATPLGRPGPYRIERSADGAQTTLFERPALDWADWTRDGSVVFGELGRLHRQRIAAGSNEVTAERTVVADLTTHEFKSIEAPAGSTEWPSSLGGKRRHGR
jgi:hypothetical protein